MTVEMNKNVIKYALLKIELNDLFHDVFIIIFLVFQMLQQLLDINKPMKHKGTVSTV